MTISISTENCCEKNYFEIEELADSSITLEIVYPKIVSMQSRKVLIDNAKAAIQKELHKFRWLICGPVMVDFVWYLNAAERQETDTIGDIDNISKPIQDALCGPNGILIDDSQIKGLYSFWMTRNDLLNDNLLKITIKFNNDYALMKEGLLFIQYSQAICTVVNVDFKEMKDILAALVLVKARLQARRNAGKVKKLGANADNYLLPSNYDFHRTRLNQFSAQVMSLANFKKQSSKSGFTFLHLLDFYRGKFKNE